VNVSLYKPKEMTFMLNAGHLGQHKCTRDLMKVKSEREDLIVIGDALYDFKRERVCNSHIVVEQLSLGSRLGRESNKQRRMAEEIEPNQIKGRAWGVDRVYYLA